MAAPRSHDYTRIYKGKDGRVHLRYQDGREQIMPKLPRQVRVEVLKISPDRHVAGWLVDESDCCTYYAIPLSLVLVRGNVRRIVRPGQLIWDWCFVKKGKQVAVASGAVHGANIPVLGLFDATTGKLLASAYPGKSCSYPSWAACLLPWNCISR